MTDLLIKNLNLTPKMSEYTAPILTKSYVDSNKLIDCHQFLQAGKAFRVQKKRMWFFRILC